MITFKSHADLSKLSTTDPAFPVIQELVRDLIEAFDTPERPYNADDEGYIILIERGDTDRILTELWDDYRLVDIPWEGVTRRGDFFLAILLLNNESGLAFVIPDEDWVQEKLRQVLEDNLDP